MTYQNKVPRFRNRFLMLFFFLLPLAVIPAYDGFRLPKLFFAVFCVAVLFLVQFPSSRFKRNLLFSPLSLLAMGVFFTSSLSVFRAVNVLESLTQLLFLMTLILLYFILVNQDESFAFWEMLVQALVFSAALISLIGIYQFWFGHIPGLKSVTGPSATFGNKNMAAHFAGIVFPFSLYLFRKFQNMFYGLIASTMGIYLFYCQTMAIFVAGLVSVIGSLILIVIKRKKDRKRTGSFQFQPVWRRGAAVKTFICLMVVIGFSTLPLFIRSSGIQAINAPVRIGKAIQGEEVGVAHRLDLWSNTLDMIGDHPWTGVGLGNWKYQYPLYHQSSRKDKRFGIGMQPKDAYNDWLQIFAETGIFGILFYCLLAVMGTVMVIKAYSRESDTHHGGMMLALFWGFLTLIAIASVGSPLKHPVQSLLFWFFLAGIHRFYHIKRQLMVPIERGALWGGRAGFFVLKVCLIIFVLFLGQLIRSDLFFYRGVTLWNEGKRTQGISRMAQAVAIFRWNHAYHSTLSRAYLRMKRPESARNAASMALKLHPNDINSLNNLGVALNMVDRPFEALAAFERGLEIKPDEAIIRFNLGLTFRNIGRYPEAVIEFQKVLKIDPRYPQARKFLNEVEGKVIGPGEEQLEN